MSDFDYMNECTARDVITMLVEKRNLSIADAMDSLSAISEENAASSEETSATTTEINRTIETLSDASRDLNQVAHDLNECLSIFK